MYAYKVGRLHEIKAQHISKVSCPHITGISTIPKLTCMYICNNWLNFPRVQFMQGRRSRRRFGGRRTNIRPTNPRKNPV